MQGKVNETAERGRGPTRPLAPFVILVAVIVSSLAFLWAVPPGTVSESEEALRPPFAAGDSGKFVAPFDLPFEWNRQGPPLFTVYEAGTALGEWRFALKPSYPLDPSSAKEIVFTSSDGSDPNANARTYTVRYAHRAVPLAVHLAVVIVAAVASFTLAGLAIERRLTRRPGARRAALAVVSCLFGVALLQFLPAVLLADRLAGTPPRLKEFYDQVFDQGTAGGIPGSTANYRVHPYLNFALNPNAAYMNERQFNERYSIRRKEPIRPRDGVTWRALMLGGSTTFGERTPREEDTWVYRLEQKMRAAHGPRYDVINGGVGGYNIIENFIHYVLLLDELEPDVVVLYVGINDVHPRLMGDLQRDYSNSRLAWRGEEHSLPASNPLLSPFAVYRYLMLQEVEKRRFAHIYAYVQRAYPPVEDWPAALKRNGTGVYQAHLENLVRLILAQGRQVVIVPQVFIPLPDNEKDPIFAQAVAEHNAVNETVARKYHVPFVEAAGTAFRRDELLDNCHFTPEGHEKMAELLFQFFESEGGGTKPQMKTDEQR